MTKWDEQDGSRHGVTREETQGAEASDEMATDVAALPMPESVGRYQIRRRIGAGAMGVVYEAYDPELDRTIALKLIRPDRAGEERKAIARARLVREARAMAKLSDPNVISVFDVGLIEDAPGQQQVFIAMELVEGTDLGAWIAQLHQTGRWKKGRAWREIVDKFLQAAAGLSAAHKAGLVHRDFKPENALVGNDGLVRVVDFGLARRPDIAEPVDIVNSTISGELGPGMNLTRTGAVLGTPAYMAPEQYRAQSVDGRTDQFALCVALHEALHGCSPFDKTSYWTRALAVTHEMLVDPPEEPPVPSHLRRVMIRGLRLNPDDRYRDMDALADELGWDPAKRQRRVFAGLGLVALVTGVGAGAYALAPSTPRPCQDVEQRLGGAWDPQHRDTLQAAILATEEPFAASTASSVLAALDGYADRWVAARTDACLATHVRQEQTPQTFERRVICLDGLRGDLEALVSELQQTDSKLVRRARAAVERLIPVEHCSDPEQLTTPIAPPPAKDAARIAEIRDALSIVRAKQSAGHPAQALALAQKVYADSQDVGYRPLTAEVGLALAELLDDNGEVNPAIERFRHTFLDAQATGDIRTAAIAATKLAIPMGADLSKTDEALGWIDISGALSERLADPPRLRTRVLNARAELMSIAGRRDEAAEFSLEAASIIEEEFGANDFLMVGALSRVAQAYALQGRFPEAIPLYRRVLELMSQHLGAEHPRQGNTHMNLAMSLLYSDSLDEAREHAQRAIALTDPYLPKVHRDRARFVGALGIIEMRRGQDAAAIANLEHSLDLQTAIYGLENNRVARTMLNLGSVHQHAGHIDQAERLFRRALTLRRKLLGPDHPDLAVLHQNLGALYLEHGRARDALVELEEGLRLRRLDQGGRQPFADTQYWYGRALHATGKKLQGLEIVREALNTIKKHGSPAKAAEISAWLDEHA